MLKTRILQSCMVIGSMGLMMGMTALADNTPQLQPDQVAQYMAPPQPAPQSFGAIAHNNVDNTAQPSTADSDSVLQPVKLGDVTYVTGGIGDEERNAMKESEKDYNLRILSASKTGDFVGDTHIVISRKGEPVLDAQSGPMMFVNLPSGNYVVEATSDGQTKKQNVTIGKSKPSYVRLSW
jgi:hypothetical protein